MNFVYIFFYGTKEPVPRFLHDTLWTHFPLRQIFLSESNFTNLVFVFQSTALHWICANKAEPCSRAVYGVGLSCLIAGIAGSNSAEGIDLRLLCLLCVCVGSGLCDGLIILPEESNWVLMCV